MVTAARLNQEAGRPASIYWLPTL